MTSQPTGNREVARFARGVTGIAPDVSDFDLLEVNLLSEHEKGGVREGLEGAVEGVKGKTKEAVGQIFGNDDLREEGRAQQSRADSQREAAQKEAEAEKHRAEAGFEEKRQQVYQDDSSRG